MPDERIPVCPACYDVIAGRLEAGEYVPIDDYHILNPHGSSCGGLDDMERGDESDLCEQHKSVALFYPK